MFDLAIDHYDRNGVEVVELSGDIDVHTGDDLRSLLTELDAAGVTRIVVDLCMVQYVDSTGLGILLAALKRAHARGGFVCLVVARPNLARMLEITGLAAVFGVSGSVSEALAARPREVPVG